jgi:hypothetical protein
MSLNLGSVINWVKPDPKKRYYELRDGDNTLASLEWKDIRSPDAEATIHDKRLFFKRKGFFFHQTSIVDADTGSELAVFKFRGVDKGALAFSDGMVLQWKFEGLMESRWYFTTVNGGELLCFSVPTTKRNVVLRNAAIVEVLYETDAKLLTLLAVIGWYNIHNILSSGL